MELGFKLHIFLNRGCFIIGSSWSLDHICNTSVCCCFSIVHFPVVFSYFVISVCFVSSNKIFCACWAKLVNLYVNARNFSSTEVILHKYWWETSTISMTSQIQLLCRLCKKKSYEINNIYEVMRINKWLWNLTFDKRINSYTWFCTSSSVHRYPIFSVQYLHPNYCRGELSSSLLIRGFTQLGLNTFNYTFVATIYKIYKRE